MHKYEYLNKLYEHNLEIILIFYAFNNHFLFLVFNEVLQSSLIPRICPMKELDDHKIHPLPTLSISFLIYSKLVSNKLHNRIDAY